MSPLGGADDPPSLFQSYGGFIGHNSQTAASDGFGKIRRSLGEGGCIEPDGRVRHDPRPQHTPRYASGRGIGRPHPVGLAHRRAKPGLFSWDSTTLSMLR